MNTMKKTAQAMSAKRRPAPIDPLVRLQKALDELTGMGPDRCDLSKVDTRRCAPARVRKGATVILKQTDKRDYAFHAATGDESLGTLSARAIGKGDNISKAAAEDAVDVAPGFTSMSRLTGKY